MSARAFFVIVVLLAGLSATTSAESWLYLLEGFFRQETQYTYEVTLQPIGKAVTVTLPLLREIAEPWYSTAVEEQAITASLPPSADRTNGDTWGNRWTTLSWPRLASETTVARRARVVSETTYGPIHTSDPYPVPGGALSRAAREALAGTDQIQKDDPAIRALAAEATSGCGAELEAVARILSAVRERVSYACSADLCDPVYRVDAAYTLQLGKGNCVSYANLALALLRAAGIPAIPANGFVADREESHAGHAWIAVFFPAWGWVEFESADWMPAYAEAPITFRMPQHITAFLGDGRGISSASFAESHTASWSVLERPERRGRAEGACRPGETIAWSCALEVPGSEPVTVCLSLEGLPEGWRGVLSSATVAFDPSLTLSNALEVLIAITPPATALGSQEAEVRLRGSVQGAVVGEVSFTINVSS